MAGTLRRTSCRPGRRPRARTCLPGWPQLRRTGEKSHRHRSPVASWPPRPSRSRQRGEVPVCRDPGGRRHPSMARGHHSPPRGALRGSCPDRRFGRPNRSRGRGTLGGRWTGRRSTPWDSCTRTGSSEAASYTPRMPGRPGGLATLTGVTRGTDTPRVKLVVAIVHSEDAGALVTALLDKEFRATRLQSSGGFLKQSNATIILGVEDADVDEVMGIVRTNCTSRTQVVNPMPPIMEPGEFFMPYPLEVEVGGATVFVLPVERFERL